MKLNTNSNAYIIIYSAIMVLIVAFLLAFVSQTLKPMQDKNVALDTEKQILNSLNMRGLSDDDAHATYEKIVKYDEARLILWFKDEHIYCGYIYDTKSKGCQYFEAINENEKDRIAKRFPFLKRMPTFTDSDKQ